MYAAHWTVNRPQVDIVGLRQAAPSSPRAGLRQGEDLLTVRPNLVPLALTVPRLRGCLCQAGYIIPASPHVR